MKWSLSCKISILDVVEVEILKTGVELNGVGIEKYRVAHLCYSIQGIGIWKETILFSFHIIANIFYLPEMGREIYHFTSSCIRVNRN